MYLFVAFIIPVASFHHRGHLVSDRHVTRGWPFPIAKRSSLLDPDGVVDFAKASESHAVCGDASTPAHLTPGPSCLQRSVAPALRLTDSHDAASTALFLSGCLPRTTLCSSTRLGPE